ncbi:MAG: hypothetical protein O4861_24260 [Trichodesmium sp. St16_bin4-tuft]|nr:hypothetical protein [Trichodesmium sp. St2_bin6]MDE5101270.1 hypothetical protein [Trichodesmium sp. St16_bin4-tuft]
MARRLSIQEHLSVDELEKNYRITHDPIERTRYQIIWLKRERKNNTHKFLQSQAIVWRLSVKLHVATTSRVKKDW